MADAGDRTEQTLTLGPWPARLVLEELVGEIFSEHVKNVPLTIQADPDGSALINGGVTIRDANRALEFELPEREWTTVAGLALAIGGRSPAVGENLVTGNGYQFEIVEASPRRIRTVRVRRSEAVAATSESALASPPGPG